MTEINRKKSQGYLEWRERKPKGNILFEKAYKDENYVEKIDLENGKQNRTGIFQEKKHKNTTENVKGTSVRLKGDKMKFNRSCNKQKNKGWPGQEEVARSMYYQTKKETTKCLYSSFIKSKYIVNVHNMYCIK